MKYVIRRDEETNEIIALGRFHENSLIERHSARGVWVRDNTLYSDLLDGLLEEISEAEANRLIAAHFSREKQTA